MTLYAALIVAAGRGSRARDTLQAKNAAPHGEDDALQAKDAAPFDGDTAPDNRPKQYVPIGGEAVLTHTLRAFLAHSDIDLVQVVIHGDDRALYDEAIALLPARMRQRLAEAVTGGADRQASVWMGLQALRAQSPDYVLVHDAARPFVNATLISNLLAALPDAGRDPAPDPAICGAIAALPVTDTLKQATADQTIETTVPRDGLWRAQTPQGFQFETLYKLHADAAIAKQHDPYATPATDDAALAERAGLGVVLVEGSARNIKLTTREDIELADHALNIDKPGMNKPNITRPGTDEENKDEGNTNQWPDVRTGTGFDVHRFAPGDHVWLGGVKIPFDKKLDGHSDADVALHALTDAILGTIGDGDIGTHFPPSDPQWKGAASDQFLADAAGRVVARGGQISNLDITIMCEKPKIGPHRTAMRDAIAAIVNIERDRISIKATTTEGLGFTGRREGIAAMASATVILPGK